MLFGNQAAVTAWRARKVDQIRKAVRDTTEAMCAVVAATGKLTWPVELEGGHRETYEVDYGPLLTYTPDALLTASSKLPEVYRLLRAMELAVKQAGLGGNVTFWAGSDVVAVLLGIVESYVSTTESKPYRVSLEQGKVLVGNYPVNFMDETCPQPGYRGLGGARRCWPWANQPGSVWYCAIRHAPAFSRTDSGVMHIWCCAHQGPGGGSAFGRNPLRAAKPSGRCGC